MLDNIKMLLGISDQDTSQDKMINYHIKSITNMIFAHCGINQLPSELETIVETIVYEKLSRGGYKDKIKKEKFDDFEVEYAVNSHDNELDPYKTILNGYKNKSKQVKFI